LSSLDPRVNPIVGAMNGDQPDHFGPYLTDDTIRDPSYVFELAMDKATSNDVNLKFPRFMICLQAEEWNADKNDYTPIPNTLQYAFGHDMQKRIRIKAYDDFIDAFLGLPRGNGSFDNWSPEQIAKINTLEWCYLDNSSGEDVPMPSIGDKVIVDFYDRENLTGRRFLGIQERIAMAPITNTLSLPLKAFQTGLGLLTTLGSLDSGPEATTPAFASIDDLCEGPVMTKGSKFGGGQVETVIIDGCPVSKDVAGYYIEMRNEAERSGVTLKLNSAFRGYEDVVVPDECGNGTKSGQNSLYNKYLAGTGNPAASPGTSQHQNGIAFDIQTGMPKDPNTPFPESITKEYKWLMERAHEFGFIRPLTSERWHWEYQPGQGRFSRVPKSHPSWDLYFS